MQDQRNREAAQRVWAARYRHAATGGAEADIGDTWKRVAHAVAAAEEAAAAEWEEHFLEVLTAGEFLPGGRIIAGAGTGSAQTLLNCYVSGPVDDSIGGVYDALKDGALTLQMGGGVGFDLSTLGTGLGPAPSAGSPAKLLPLWNDTAELIVGRGGRRGAMMLSLAADHPDVLEFVAAKTRRPLPRLTLAIQVSDGLVAAVRGDRDWPLRAAAGASAGRRLRARELWAAIATASHACGDPGVLFTDRINRDNNLHYCERLATTNPCGEAPLPAHGGCDLGSINLVALVREPFTARARLDEERLRYVAGVAVRLLDDVLDVTAYPHPQQRAAALASRRVGLGITGLADALVLLGIRYDEPAAAAAVARIGASLRDVAYEASTTLAAAKGAFPAYVAEPYLRGPFIARLPAVLRERIGRHGIRNSHLLAIAPAGSISLLAGNVSSGVEPPTAPAYRLRVWLDGPEPDTLPLENVACALWRERGHAGLPPAFVAATDVSPAAHLAIQAALQMQVDGAISKTVALPAAADVAIVQRVLDAALDSNVKGLTVFRSGTAGAPLSCRSECG